jgi:hypothetical protein
MAKEFLYYNPELEIWREIYGVKEKCTFQWGRTLTTREKWGGMAVSSAYSTGLVGHHLMTDIPARMKADIKGF